ncbi:glycosyltransferase family A protein [Ancylobacter defluvii]|uniref:Glycosyltransferase 2-like domain-containing protein n=1 Tax=Ancylobacter defluvii TaxID=1282440 RepID=A0A9W6JWQ7_9HYPH|nr:glycosyltransferase family A protein [Ancylobacter defluvii]MBS7588633.1 glycosyltransferase family 2 protein [Ancylobacter defluvii]GLK83913.1 hypothetical protein GCM10017653_19830 [Ancylobacter defluvii]
MEKVIIGLTSIRARQDKLHLTLASLLQQDYPDFEIRVFTSRDPYLLDEGIEDIPPACRELAADGRLRWFRVPNSGPYRKLLPILADPLAQEALIATADDDTIYPAHWLSTLVHYYRRHRCIVAFRGHRMVKGDGGFLPYRYWTSQTITDNPSVFLLPTGKDGVLYHPSFFHPAVLDMITAMKAAPTADDLWFKWHSAVNGVPVYVVHPDYRLASLPDTNEGASLFRDFNDGGANDGAIAALEKYADGKLGMTLARL